jgi:hypothetical protein
LFQIQNLFQFKIYSKFEIYSKLEFCSNLKFIPISYSKYIYAHLNLFKQKNERENLPVGPNFVGPYGDRSQAGAIRSRKGRDIAAPDCDSVSNGAAMRRTSSTRGEAAPTGWEPRPVLGK